ncbi:MAG: hypothetical protein RH980_18305 [Roseovarius confluentis]
MIREILSRIPWRRSDALVAKEREQLDAERRRDVESVKARAEMLEGLVEKLRKERPNNG